MENQELSLLELFEKYNAMPLQTRRVVSEIYDKGYVIQTGMSIIAPHPHRHYDFDEFVEKYEGSDDFKKFVNESKTVN